MSKNGTFCDLFPKQPIYTINYELLDELKREETKLQSSEDSNEDEEKPVTFHEEEMICSTLTDRCVQFEQTITIDYTESTTENTS
ncbi:hypothetical protein V7138_08180 [Bacillus sp. JJ1533]|uniref:hypothetical protein n=1 Tax=Bacillus sp. JJ1533 TaxID=3122959 RepID=UPI002FFE2954